MKKNKNILVYIIIGLIALVIFGGQMFKKEASGELYTGLSNAEDACQVYIGNGEPSCYVYNKTSLVNKYCVVYPGDTPADCGGSGLVFVKSFFGASDEYTCEDNEDPYNKNLKGSVEISLNGEYYDVEYDYCSNNKSYDLVCESGTFNNAIDSYSAVSHTCDYGCSNGKCNSAPTTTCTETDSGADYYNKGTTTDATQSVTDTCVGTKLYEIQCINNIATQLAAYNCTNGCTNGACLQGVNPIDDYCDDSVDNGPDYFVKGTTTGVKNNVQFNLIDYCTSNTVTEYYCVGTEQKTNTRACSGGCSSGKCNADVIPLNSCNETDGGNFADVAGTTLGYKDSVAYEFTDYCKTNTSVFEYYCTSLTANNNIKTCSEKCVNGACVSCSAYTNVGCGSRTCGTTTCPLGNMCKAQDCGGVVSYQCVLDATCPKTNPVNNTNQTIPTNNTNGTTPIGVSCVADVKCKESGFCVAESGKCVNVCSPWTKWNANATFNSKTPEDSCETNTTVILIILAVVGGFIALRSMGKRPRGN
jgi:hypothetical protein